MLRTFAAVAASLILLSLHGPLWAGSEERDSDLSNTVESPGAFHAQVRRLQGELQRHRALADAGGWPKVPGGPTIRPDTEDWRLAALARRLAVSNDLSQDVASISMSQYNETLQDAVRLFQVRHGLDVDGLVGRATLRALNVPIEKRIDQIRVNLERARRLSDSLGDDVVLVNIAAFKAYVIAAGEIVWTTRIIVGEKDDETPLFQSTLTSVVFNPTWTVPFSIASEEMLPRIKEDPGFFDKGGYQLFDRDGNEVEPSSIDWSAVSEHRFPFTIVQQPGPLNQLGQIKFLFPNVYSVCMHDTPAKALFAKTARAFSHGCIRVDEPGDFAEVLLRSEGWSRKKIDSQLDSDETRAVRLSKPLPVIVSYWTAEVDDAGKMHFYDDIYGRDGAFLRALDRPLSSDQL